MDVQGNRYSVPGQLCGETISIRISLDDQLRVFDATDTLVANHRLVPRSAGWQSLPEHHAQLWRDTLRVEKRDLRTYEEVA